MEHVGGGTVMQLAQPSQIDTADARTIPAPWAGLKPFLPNWSALRDNRIVVGAHFEPANAAFGILRTKVLRLMSENGWRSILVTSPTAGCGKSVVSINLAFSLARVPGRRIALLDLDFHHPSVAKYLELEAPTPMQRFLTGSASLEDVFVSWQDALAIGANESPAADPIGILQNPATQVAIAKIYEGLQPNIVVFDMPPVFGNGDVLAFAPNVDCALLVAGAGTSTISEIETCERELSRSTNVLGTVLNKCEFKQRSGGYSGGY